MYQEFKDRADFYVIYIREAHAADAWQLPDNLTDKVIFPTPTDYFQRGATAQACVRDLGIELPALLDSMDNATETAYTAWPDRIYLIDKQGIVRHKSGPGPFGFKPGALRAELASRRWF